MEMTACEDRRARGMFQFYGANRTGRFAGRHIQLQNLPQNHLPDLSEARDWYVRGITKLWNSCMIPSPDVLSQLIRTAFVPQKGMKFVVSDFRHEQGAFMASRRSLALGRLCPKWRYLLCFG